jgi:hypothetical protein
VVQGRLTTEQMGTRIARKGETDRGGSAFVAVGDGAA